MVKLELTVLLTVILLIMFKSNSEFKDKFYHEVYETSMPFVEIDKKFYGLFDKKEVPVMNNIIDYDSEEFMDGLIYKVDEDYLVPVLKNGLVTYIGYSDIYGNTVTVSGYDGKEITYGFLDDIKVKLYDYVSQDEYIGSSHNKLYIYEN